MGNFKRNRLLKNVRFSNQIELLDLIDAGVQTNASLIAFSGANTASVKMKRITQKEDAVLREESSVFGGRGTFFYRMKNQQLDYLDAKINNAISHAVYLLRDNNILLNVVKPVSLAEYEVSYRTQALISESGVSELIFSYYDSSQGNINFVDKFLNFDPDLARVIVFEDVVTYRRFLRNVERKNARNKINNQLHVVLDSAQSLVKSSNFDMKVFTLTNHNHTELNGENILDIIKLYQFKDKNLARSIAEDFYKAKRNAEKFERVRSEKRV